MPTTDGIVSYDRVERLYERACTTETDIHEHLPLLRSLASGCESVTELGTRGGNSTIAFLAARPQRLTCYDLAKWPQVGRIAELAGHIGVEFRFAQEDSLRADIAETDLLFIDTWHAYEQLRRELSLHASKVRKYIVLHDTAKDGYGLRGEGGATRGLLPAVEEFLQRGTFRIEQHRENNNGLTVLERIVPELQSRHASDAPEGDALVYLAIPFYEDVYGQVVDNFDNAVDPHGGNRYAKWYNGGSFHCRNFNELWCGALNSRSFGWSHFAMLHADVQPRGFWLDGMLRGLRSSGADLLSVVLPIKTHHGLTSTALRNRDSGVFRRLTMREVHRLPETFDGPTVVNALGWEGEWELLASTGLWVCDFTKPWVESVYFDNPNRITQRPDGQFVAECVSEDWHFSLQLLSRGLKVVATRSVQALHWGRVDFRNDIPWGSQEQDEEASPYGEWYSPPQPSTTAGSEDACRMNSSPPSRGAL